MLLIVVTYGGKYKHILVYVQGLEVSMLAISPSRSSPSKLPRKLTLEDAGTLQSNADYGRGKALKLVSLYQLSAFRFLIVLKTRPPQKILISLACHFHGSSPSPPEPISRWVGFF